MASCFQSGQLAMMPALLLGVATVGSSSGVHVHPDGAIDGYLRFDGSFGTHANVFDTISSCCSSEYMLANPRLIDCTDHVRWGHGDRAFRWSRLPARAMLLRSRHARHRWRRPQPAARRCRDSTLCLQPGQPVRWIHDDATESAELCWGRTCSELVHLLLNGAMWRRCIG